jgi:hypothetical protein
MQPPVEFEANGYTVSITPGNPITICEIRSNGIPPLVYGLGVRKHGDVYDRVEGMQRALASALRKLLKDDRQLVWNEFFLIYPRDARPEPDYEQAGNQVIACLNEATAIMRKLEKSQLI